MTRPKIKGSTLNITKTSTVDLLTVPGVLVERDGEVVMLKLLFAGETQKFQFTNPDGSNVVLIVRSPNVPVHADAPLFQHTRRWLAKRKLARQEPLLPSADN